MKIIIHWIVSALAVLLAAYFLRGIHVTGFTAALATALVLGLINAVLRPVLVILTLPITVVTLGLFMLVINGLLVLLAAQVVPGFSVDGFWWALAFSVVVSVLNSLLRGLVPDTSEKQMRN